MGSGGLWTGFGQVEQVLEPRAHHAVQTPGPEAGAGSGCQRETVSDGQHRKGQCGALGPRSGQWLADDKCSESAFRI